MAHCGRTTTGQRRPQTPALCPRIIPCTPITLSPSPGRILRPWQSSETRSITNTTVCTKCGGAGHIASDCKFARWDPRQRRPLPQEQGLGVAREPLAPQIHPNPGETPKIDLEPPDNNPNPSAPSQID